MKPLYDKYYDLLLNLRALACFIKNDQNFAYEYKKYIIRQLRDIVEHKKNNSVQFLDEETEQFFDAVDLEDNLDNVYVLQEQFYSEIKKALKIEWE